MRRFPVELLFHHLLHYLGNAVEMDETFCDLFHILRLKALETERRDLFIVLVTASICTEQKWRT